jgi:hypothetical protein
MSADHPSAGDHRDLIFAGVFAVIATAVVVIDAPPILRAAFSIPLVLFLPGYALINALLPSKELPAVERLTIAIGASLSLTILWGFLLAVSPVRLGAIQWTVMLAAATLVLLIVALHRRGQRHEPSPSLTIPRLRSLDAVLLAAAALSLVGVIFGMRIITAQLEEPPPALLWMLPASDGTLGAQLGVRAGRPEGGYLVRVTSAGVTLHEFRLSLDIGETWETLVAFTEQDRARPIVARLYDATGDQELRFVVLQPPPDGG